VPPEVLGKVAPMFASFRKHNPTFTGPMSPQAAVQKVMKVAQEATVEKDGGSFVSHHGNKEWL
jgi:hypothetical protein